MGVPRRCIGRLIGSLSSQETSLFRKFARAKTRPLYRKFHRRIYSTALSSHERMIHHRRASIIAEFAPPRRVRPRPLKPDWVVYSDPSSTMARICALLFRGRRSSPDLHTCRVSRADVVWIYLFRRTDLIYGMELLALALFDDSSDFLQSS